jgi:hypothetical protein
MQSVSPHSCIPRALAVYIVAYVVAQELPLLPDYLGYMFTIATPGPTLITSIAATVTRAVFLFWLPLSVFVWLRYMWARWSLAWSALVLGIAQCVSYTEMLRQYRSATIVSEVLVLAIPTFFVAFITFCPTIGATFERHTDRI